MSNAIISQHIGAQGSKDADVMAVAKAPGKQEAKKGRPFAGKSGGLLRDYLSRVRLRPVRDVFLTNLAKYRPAGDNFEAIRGTRYLEEGLAELEQEIKEVDPNLIIALGNWPLYYLTGKHGKKPGSGILRWRGSVLEGTGPAEGYKVLATYNPAYLFRGAWKMHPVFEFDLQYAAEEAKYDEIRRPEYDIYLAGNDPMHDDYVTPDEAEQLVSEMSQAEWLCVDIETFHDQTMSCCGFADSTDRAFVVTFQRNGGWRLVKTLFESPARKIFQFGTYDVTFVDRFYDFDTVSFRPDLEWRGEDPPVIKNLGWDTYIAAATLMPEFPQGLDFLASIYTQFPYYKEDRKEWKEGNVDFDTLWAYNAKDVIAEFTVAAKQMQEMAEDWDFDVPAPLAEV